MTGESEKTGIALRVVEDLSGVTPKEWNKLSAAAFPFLRHEFLHALEIGGCLGERYGWLPRHVLARDAGGRLLGAVPLYLKLNSYGEFVFDWAWADAYERSGLQYYPKLVSAAPYTPATGPKILLHPDAPADMADLLIEGVMELAHSMDVSSLHWLFTPEDETSRLVRCGLLRRMGCQFHWQNQGYRDFDDYLATFSSAKRKNIRRERRRVREAGIVLRRKDGHQASTSDWQSFHRLYESTFHKRGGMPTLSLDFFTRIARLMPDAVLLIEALHGERLVATAFCLVGDTTLYGRHWGCHESFNSLHFEACYYQGLDFCIENGLQRFEPGAQGEHKISRGFLPVPTWSAHWLADARFGRAIGSFLDDETGAMQDYMAELADRSPFRKAQQ